MARKSRRKKPRTLIFLLLLILVTIVGLNYQFTFASNSQSLFEYISEGKTKSDRPLSMQDELPVLIPSKSLYSSHAILLRLTDNKILMQKKSEEKIYPASLSKIMTTIIAIENLPNLQEKIKLSKEMFQALYNADAAMAGFQPEEKVSAVDLLYGAMLPSGAESCVGLANQIANSESEFVRVMNQKALKLGMKNTHFTNVTGLSDSNHYTTVKDLAILLNYALQNETFRQIFTSASHHTAPTNKHPYGITLYSTLFEKLKDPSLIQGRILGGKTGYTDKAGLCLASLAAVGGKEYILITTGAKGDHQSEQYNITDALAVYNSLGKA